MAVTNADILGWLNANPGADDTLIAQTMQQAGVSPDQMAQATGLNYGDVASRYEAALAPTTSAPTYSSTDEQGAPVYDYYAQQFAPDVYASPAATTSTPVTTVEDLYREVLGREPDAEGLAFWQQGFGGSVDAAEKASFLQAAQAELANRSVEEQALLAPKIVDTSATGVTDADILGWFKANPGADDATIARVMQEAAVTPAQVARATGSDYGDINSRYLAATGIASLPGAGQTQTTTAATAVANPLIKLYEDTLGRTPTQEEIDSWGFGETIDAGELDRFLGSARNEAVTTQPTTGAAGHIASQILAQGTTQYWGGEGYGSTTQNAYDMGVLLAGQGLTDINQLGKVTKEVPTYSTDENGNQIETGTQTITQFINKATGQPINTYYDKAAQNGPDIWGGTFAGEGSTAYGVKFTADGKPIFYSKYGGSSSDIADWGPILSLAAVIPSPIQPFAIAANAAIAIENDDILGGIAALAGLAGFSDVAAGARILKAADSGDPFAIVSSIMNSPFAGDVGGTMLTDTISLRDAGNAVSVFNNVQNENWAGALTAANQLVNSPDLATAAAAARFINAFEKNNFAGMYTAANGFTNAMNAANKVTDKDVALNITNALADANSAATEGTQLASLASGIVSDAGNGLTLSGDGGSTLNFPDLTGSDSINADATLFDSSVGDLDATGNITDTTGLDMGDVIPDTGDGVEELVVTGTDTTGLDMGDVIPDTGTGTVVDDKGEVVIKGTKESCPVGTVLNPVTGDCDPYWDEGTGDDVVVDDKGEVVITAKPESCPVGTVLNPETGECDAVDDKGEVVITAKPESCPVGTTLNPETGECDPDWDEGGGEVCGVGERLDPETGMCVPDETKTITCPPGKVLNEAGTACIDETIITDKPESCPVGTVLNRETGECDPVDDTDDKECPEGYVRNLETGQCEKVDTKTCPTGYSLKDGKCVKDPIVTPPKPCPTGYERVNGACVPICQPGYMRIDGVCKKIPTEVITMPMSGPVDSGEKTDPIYAGGMDSFNLLATLQELLAEEPPKKDDKKSKDKTKMATGGHLDDLLAEQMTVDDLLKLLR